MRSNPLLKTGKFVAILLAALAWVASLSGAENPTASSPSKPNIVVILADDLGYGDVSFLNPEPKVPLTAYRPTRSGGRLRHRRALAQFDL